MTRHEPLSTQTAIPPLRPTGGIAPSNSRAVMALVLRHIYRRKHTPISRGVVPYVPYAPAASPSAPAQCWSPGGQIQKNP